MPLMVESFNIVISKGALAYLVDKHIHKKHFRAFQCFKGRWDIFCNGTILKSY